MVLFPYQSVVMEITDYSVEKKNPVEGTETHSILIRSTGV